MPLYQAREVARRNDLDLVEVAANPPVCRMLNYGKFRYEQDKKDKEAKKGQKSSSIREIRLRPKIGEGDFDTKVKSVRKHIEEGDKVRVTIMFRGREITHPDLALKLVHRVVEGVKDIAVVEQSPAMDGRRMVAQLAPSPSLKAKSKEKVQEIQNA
jgi:translation initiation factor IF-3